MAVGQQGQQGFKNSLFPVLVAGNTIRIDKSGLFIYSGPPALGSLIAAAVPTGVTSDIPGNQVTAVLSAGKWSGTGVAAGISMVDQNGNLSVFGTDNVARLRIFTGADGVANHHAGSVWWLNDFGAVIQVIDPVVGATIQYRDLGSASQGGVLGAQVAGTADIIDPITGVVLHPGITLIDPIFGDNLSIQGDVVGFDQLGMTRKCFISSQDPAGATNAPFLAVDAPEHTTASHWQGIYFGATQDGTTHPPKALFNIQSGNGNPPNVKTNSFLELQTATGQGGIAVIQGSAANGINPLDCFVSGDTSPRVSIGMLTNTGLFFGPGNAGTDTDLIRNGVASLQTDGSLFVNGNVVGGGILSVKNATGAPTSANVAINNAAAGDNAIGIFVNGDTGGTGHFRLQIDSNGKHAWGAGGGAATDTTLYRQAASELKTDGQFDCNILFAATKAVLANQGSAPANIAGDTQMVGSNADMMFTVGANNTTGFVPVSNADATQYTAATASAVAITKAWTIPAGGGGNIGATYVMKVFGHGKQGSTQQSPTFSFILNGASIFTASLPTTFAVASANFGFECELKIMVFSTGSGGTIWAEMSAMGAASIQIGALLATQAFNTTVANNVGIDAQWGSVTGAPTLTSTGNFFQKVA